MSIEITALHTGEVLNWIQHSIFNPRLQSSKAGLNEARLD